MKKTILSFTVVLFVLAGSVACKKTAIGNGTCVCTFEGEEITSDPGLTKAECQAVEDATSGLGVTCSLK